MLITNHIDSPPVLAAITTPAATQETFLPCYMVNNLTKNTEEQCNFIIDNNCLEEDGMFDYVYLVYCDLGYEFRYPAIGLIASLVIVLFLNLSSIADEFLCPSLLTVAKSLRMSDSLAGVTLLAFGNGCPDIFASLAAASSNRPDLIIGELLGAGIFCTSIVAGLVFISTEFKPAARPLLRDGTFYLFSVALVWYYCSQETITFYGSLAFIIIYAIYLIVALGDQFIQSRLSKTYPMSEVISQSQENQMRTKKGSLANENVFICRRSSQSIVAEALNSQKKLSSVIPSEPDKPISTIEQCSIEIKIVKKDGCTCDRTKQNSLTRNNASVAKLELDSNNLVKLSSPSGSEIFQNKSKEQNSNNENSTNRIANDLDEWYEFLNQLNPFNLSEWSETSYRGRITQILRAPILLLTILTVPVVDLDKRDGNWCRLLNSLHCFMVPAAIVWMTPSQSIYLKMQQQEEEFDRSQMLPFIHNENNSILLTTIIKAALFIPGLILAIFVYKSTERTKAPNYHAAFAYVGFAMSVVWIYLLANEIISLLKTVGIIFSMTDTAIGLGILAWGNSLGDIVANLSLAEAGYPRMALGASIGAPLLNLLLGFGLSFTIELKPGLDLPVKYSPTVNLLCSTLIIILIILMLSVLLPSNKSRKLFGYILIAGYGVYFLLAVLLECGVL